MIQYLDNKNFTSTIETNDVVLVDFYADWCGPCQAMHPTLERLAKNYDGKAIISKINVDKNQDLSQQFGVRSIPALFYFKNGQLAGSEVGVQSEKAISDNLNHLIKITA